MHVLVPGARIQANTVPLFVFIWEGFIQEGLFWFDGSEGSKSKIEWASLVQPLVMVFLLAEFWGITKRHMASKREHMCLQYQILVLLMSSMLVFQITSLYFQENIFLLSLWKIELCFLQLEGYQCFMIICMVIIVLHDNQLQSHFSLLGNLNYSQCPPGLEESWRSATKYCPCRSELRKGGCL